MICPVILCGGSGSRLWPLSREGHPKQFMNLGNGRTLFKDTLKRLAHLENCVAPIIVANRDHKFHILEGLKECGVKGELLLEPEPRNTAPAVAVAAHAAMEYAADSTPLLLVMPSDHSINDNMAFAASISCAAPLAENGKIILFGIPPVSPETGYGYIKIGAPMENDAFAVEKFVEKPDAQNAARMCAETGHFWNSGIFLLRADIYLKELERHSPDIAASAKKAWATARRQNNMMKPGEAFLQSPNISIDYAVMQYTDKAVVFPMQHGWLDMGSWNSFYQQGKKDDAGNVLNGDIITTGVRNCYLHGSSRLVAAVDVENLAIVETKDAILVAARDSLQKVKKIVEDLKIAGRSEAQFHAMVFRPWGNYENICTAERFKVKRITVNPGASISLQLHNHRAEHWVVVSGAAEITNGETTGIFYPNQSTYIPAGTKHRLHNPLDEPLIIIETQSGDYLGEDDIVRFIDNYGRVEDGTL